MDRQTYFSYIQGEIDVESIPYSSSPLQHGVWLKNCNYQGCQVRWYDASGCYIIITLYSANPPAAYNVILFFNTVGDPVLLMDDGIANASLAALPYVGGVLPRTVIVTTDPVGATVTVDGVNKGVT